MQSPSAEPFSCQKRTPLPVYPIFTSSPTSASFKRPVFKDKVSSKTRQHLETTNPSQHQVKQQSSSATKESGVSCLGIADVSSENKVEPCSLVLEPSALTSPPTFEREPASADNPSEDEMDEDQTIFFTPELFEGEGDECSPQKTTQSPPKMVLGAQSSALLVEKHPSNKAEVQGEASAFDRQSVSSVDRESAELLKGQIYEIKEEKQDEEGVQVDNRGRQAGSRLHRLSRPRQKVSSLPTGNLQPIHSEQEKI